MTTNIPKPARWALNAIVGYVYFCLCLVAGMIVFSIIGGVLSIFVRDVYATVVSIGYLFGFLGFIGTVIERKKFYIMNTKPCISKSIGKK